ncbi:MAG: DUF3343 domain-containing protein [Clostridia bacterium]|nr:DUF3343 domain-containing protein [Clostridia bacterium]
MQTYIATFFSHFGAIRFNKELKAAGLHGKLMPVPRRVSSSCGTCVKFEAESDTAVHSDDLEQLFLVEGEVLTMLRSNI